MTRQQVRLAGGRRLDYLELGDPAGAPAVYLHGTPSSGSEARWLHEPAVAHGVRLVSPDRPGYLQSALRPDASVLGVAEDVAALADALQLGRFAVVGFSGGAGYALATAHVAPDPVTVVHVGGGIGPLAGEGWQVLPRPRRLGFRLVTGAPAVSAPMLGGVFRLLRRRLRKRLDSPANAALWLFEGPAKGAQIDAVAEYVRSSPPEELRAELADYAEGTKATKAAVADLVAYARPWPFELRSVSARVELWHGRDDPAAPVAFAERAAAELPNARAHLFDGEGHFVFHTHGDEVCASIREHAGG